MCLIAHIPTSPKITDILNSTTTPTPDHWSSFSELSEGLSPGLRSSWCPPKNSTRNSHIVHLFLSWHSLQEIAVILSQFPLSQRDEVWGCYFLQLSLVGRMMGQPSFTDRRTGAWESQTWEKLNLRRLASSRLCIRAQSVQSHPTLLDPMDRSPPGCSVHGILQVRILEWVAMPSSRLSSRPRDRTHISCISCIAGGFFTAEPKGSRLVDKIQRKPISWDAVIAQMPPNSAT